MASARAIATRCIWPPDSSVGLWSHAVARGRPASSSSLDALAARSRVERPGEQQRHLDVLERGELRQQVEVLEHEADAAVADLGQAVDREPADLLAARAGRSPGRACRGSR